MKNDILKEFVELILSEERQTTETAGDLCLYSQKSSFILYDSGSLLEYLKEINDEIESDMPIADVFYDKIYTEEVTKRWMRGYISLAKSSRGKCWGAHTVKLVAAIKSYGPLMYDIAMTKLGPIISDRTMVSKFAQNVWQKYSISDFVKKKQLDNIDDPKTPPTVDDCQIFTDDRGDYLNFAYEIKEPVDSSGLSANHNEFIKNYVALGKSIGREKELNKNEATTMLISSADAFFDLMYK